MHLQSNLSDRDPIVRMAKQSSSHFPSTCGFQQDGHGAAVRTENRNFVDRNNKPHWEDQKATRGPVEYFLFQFEKRAQQTSQGYRDRDESQVPALDPCWGYSKAVWGTTDLVEECDHVSYQIFGRPVEDLAANCGLLLCQWALENHVGETWVRS